MCSKQKTSRGPDSAPPPAGNRAKDEKEDNVPEFDNMLSFEMKIKSRRLAHPSVILVGSFISCNKPKVSAVS